jgi:tripartite-type tricarboxylate transporter receptor subunit TctC
MVRSQSKATYATWGVGSISHLTMEALNERQGIKLTHVPYQGTVAALKDMVSGLVDFMFADMPVSLQLIRAGKLRAVAVPAGQRSPAFPGIPTIAELGFDGFDFFSWQGLIARKGTPAAAAEKLSAAIQDIMRTPQMAQELAERGMEAWPAPPARFREQVLNDTAKMRAIITQRGITLG